MIYVIGRVPLNLRYLSGCGTLFHQVDIWAEFMSWARAQAVYQLDIETTVTKYWCNKKIITIQFGDVNGEDRWVLQWSFLTEDQRCWTLHFLQDHSKKKIIHNAAFELTIFRFYGARITNVYDTMLAEKVLHGGSFDASKEYGLDDLTRVYLHREMDKSMQLAFGDDQLDLKKIEYAIQDVTYLGAIMRMQIPLLQQEDLDWTAALENEAVLSYAEMMFHGLDFDKERWLDNIELARPVVDEAQKDLDAWLLHDDFKQAALSLGILHEQDKLTLNWRSHDDKLKVFQEVFPGIPGATKIILKKALTQFYLHLPDSPLIPALENVVENQDYKELENIMMSEHRDFLVEQELMIPAWTPVINWNSQVQVLRLLQNSVTPRLKDLSEETFGRQTHPIFESITRYKKALKLLSTYGTQFIEKYLEPDGKIRTTYNQVVDTGRVSSKAPNMQNIPADEKLENRYRNCFKPPNGWRIVDSDYTGQELVFIAHLSQDPVWDKALRAGQDLHSICAELVFGKKWRDATGINCQFSATKQKCKCPGHKTLRTAIKTINFGLAYGMSAFKLASELRIPLKEAEGLILQYFTVFPKIGKLLDKLGMFGVWFGYSRTVAPFFRKRFYPNWAMLKPYIQAHLAKIEYSPGLGHIERQAKNHPIQGSSADNIKTAACMMYWHIHDNNLSDKVWMVGQVHDEQLTVTKADIADDWSNQMNHIMEQAALVFIPTGLLKADTHVMQEWTKL